MKIWMHTAKYVLEIAGCGSIDHYGFYIPYRMWRRVWYFPFIYNVLGYLYMPPGSTEKDIGEWIKWKESNKL